MRIWRTKNYLIKDIAVIGLTGNSLRERMLRESNLTLQKALALGQSPKQTKIHPEELKQEASICRIKSFKNENRYLQPEKK